MKQKLIFLDIDGVLNHAGINEKIKGCIGILDSKLELLKEIVSATDATIILTSTWKHDWEKDAPYDMLNPYGQYMIDKFNNHGLRIEDKTTDTSTPLRGAGIQAYIETHNLQDANYVIIDDDMFDFSQEQKARLIKTSFYSLNGGLQNKHLKQAIAILNKEDC